MMDSDVTHSVLLSALTIVRLTTVPLFLLSLLFAFTRRKTVTPASPSSITAVVVLNVSPRRALLLTFFGFSAFTYLLDGLIVFVYWVLEGIRQGYSTQWRGVELADVAGFLAFSTVISIGLWKDRSGIDLWLRKRLKAWLILAILFDIAYLVLLVLAVRIFKKRPETPGIPERPYIPGIYVPNFLHFIALDVRLLIELITLIVLFKPYTTYSTAHDAHGRAPAATPSTLLLPASLAGQHNSNQPAYGTFAPPPNTNTASLEAQGNKHGYDVEAQQQQHLAEGSSSRSGYSKKDKDPAIGEDISEEPEPLVRSEPEVEEVPNPVTDDPTVLSYAAVAAKHENKADEEGQDIVINQDVTESPSAFAFPSATRDDSSSLRNVTFSQDAVGDRSMDTEGGGEETGIDGKKRRRISSQNFKRIVRKISEIPRRQGSISSMGSASRAAAGGPVSREDSRVSGEGSIGYGIGDSPAASVDGDGKKGRFRKRLSLSLRKTPGEAKQDST